MDVIRHQDVNGAEERVPSGNVQNKLAEAGMKAIMEPAGCPILKG
jgi:hypothetical protein